MPTIAESFLAEIESEATKTRRLLALVPHDKLDYRPHPKSMTLGQLALHIAQIPGGLASVAMGPGLDAGAVDFTPRSPKGAGELLPALDASLAQAKAALAGLDDAKANAPWTLSVGAKELSTVPRAAILRNLMLNHWYHHRGQLTVYLRLLGVSLPVTYGRSADENPFAATA